MKPTDEFPMNIEQNLVLKAAPGDEDNINDLPAHRTGPYIITCWQLSIKERIRMLFSGKVMLAVRGISHPPIFMTVNPEDIWGKRVR